MRAKAWHPLGVPTTVDRTTTPSIINIIPIITHFISIPDESEYLTIAEFSKEE
ncbi:hypothetical protein Alg215_06233 [Pyrenophora tritici-repentis]|nr:hypothetical protein Alg215_06233 [Pyrenophora tritici-repentis]